MNVFTMNVKTVLHALMISTSIIVHVLLATLEDFVKMTSMNVIEDHVFMLRKEMNVTTWSMIIAATALKALQKRIATFVKILNFATLVMAVVLKASCSTPGEI